MKRRSKRALETSVNRFRARPKEYIRRPNIHTKTVAVGTLAVGIVDVIDGADHSDWAESDQDPDNIGNGADANGHPVGSYTGYSEVAASIESEESTGTHHVRPHWVEGHWRDGQWIEGYWRDGDGDTDVNLTEQQGGGYERTNPDGNPDNNLT